MYEGAGLGPEDVDPKSGVCTTESQSTQRSIKTLKKSNATFPVTVGRFYLMNNLCDLCASVVNCSF
jgi:hypothetical protein